MAGTAVVNEAVAALVVALAEVTPTILPAPGSVLGGVVAGVVRSELCKGSELFPSDKDEALNVFVLSSICAYWRM